MLKKLLLTLVVIIAAFLGAGLVSGLGWLGIHEGGGEGSGARRSAASVDHVVSVQREARAAIDAPGDKQILFGDLHVHTTLSTDAFLMSLPLAQGEGAHPPADACDFARFCSALDFWSINDHAENMTPVQWGETVESIRACNAVTGSEASIDTVAFLGWEWTQVGITPETHYGHKNVVLRGLEDDAIPARPIASRGLANAALSGPGVLARGAAALAVGGQRMHDFALFLTERSRNVACASGVDVRSLPADCVESVETPGELYAKLDEWGFDSIVIPHGTSWGFYTPAGSSWDKQLEVAQHDPQRQTLIEIFSGHGNSEEYRDWNAIEFDAAGEPVCPAPRPDYLPSCWRAGEIIRERCLEAGDTAGECDARAALTRKYAAAAGIAAHRVVSGEDPDEWLDAGQCRDCFQPPLNHRPRSSVQYIMALRNFDAPAEADRFRFGFIASSDNHFARPGTGYKEVHRRGMTESRDLSQAGALVGAPPGEPLPTPVEFDRETTNLTPFQLVEMERQASFFLTGGLAAVHASGRTRDDIWRGLDEREVYATSGPRILLWFDLLNAPNGAARIPMGGGVSMLDAPQFEVRAVGSFEQKPGCPEQSVSALGAEQIAHLCKGECYNPSDVRRPITRIEIVRIQPQNEPGEAVRGLVEDPWQVFECGDDMSGCVVRFSDPDYAKNGRDSLYYVRAIEEPDLAINAANLRCEYDDNGECIRVNRCGTPATEFDDCLAETEERAWSSPIFVDWPEGA